MFIFPSRCPVAEDLMSFAYLGAIQETARHLFLQEASVLPRLVPSTMASRTVWARQCSLTLLLGQSHHTPGNARHAGEWAKEALGPDPSPTSCCAQWLSTGSTSGLWLWAQWGPSTLFSLRYVLSRGKCCSVCLCPAAWDSLPQPSRFLGWAVPVCWDRPPQGCPSSHMVTPSHTWALLCVDVGRHLFYVLQRGNNSHLHNTAMKKIFICTNNWVWWRPFAWGQEAAKMSQCFCMLK